MSSAKRAFYALTLRPLSTVIGCAINFKWKVQSEHFMLSRLRPLSSEIGCARNFKCKASILCSHAKTIVNRDWMREKFQVESAKRAFYAVTLKTIVNRDWMCAK